jgi:hypothetical protein
VNACGRGLRATSQSPQPRGARQPGTPAHRRRHAYPGRGRASAPGRESAGAKGFVAVVARAAGDSAGSRSHLALLRRALRPGAYLPLPQAESMGWTTPRVRHPQQADRWSWLVVVAYTQLRLARSRVADLRLPWERRYDRGKLTPVRLHRVVSSLLVELGTPAKAPKPCGRSPGRAKGRLSGRARRYPAIKTAA